MTKPHILALSRLNPCLAWFAACLLFFTSVSAHAQMRWNQAYQQYVDQYKDLAIEQMLRYNIPASITLAQGLFESRAGQSVLATQGNNHFGIKCHGWGGRTMYHDDDERGECFRAYENASKVLRIIASFLHATHATHDCFL